MVVDDFLNDEIQKSLGKFGVQIGPFRQVFSTCDLGRFAGRIGRGQVVFGFEFPHSLRVLEPLAQCIDKDGIKTVDAFAVLFQHDRGAGYGVSQWRSLSV